MLSRHIPRLCRDGFVSFQSLTETTITAAGENLDYTNNPDWLFTFKMCMGEIRACLRACVHARWRVRAWVRVCTWLTRIIVPCLNMFRVCRDVSQTSRDTASRALIFCCVRPNPPSCCRRVRYLPMTGTWVGSQHL